MTDSADHRPSTADYASDTQHPRSPPPFEPIFTLVDNATSRTTNHPHVRYIFSDDDPDVWTRALAECEHTYAHESGSDPALANRAMALDLTRNEDGGYSVAWASSLSPSWAVLNAQLSQISPPSSDAGHSSSGPGEAGPRNGRSERLMLRIEGIETCPPNSSSELRISDEANRQYSSSASGSGQRERALEVEDYASMLDEFEKRMKTLRKVVDASEDRRKKIASQNTDPEDMPTQEVVAEETTTIPEQDTVPGDGLN